MLFQTTITLLLTLTPLTIALPAPSLSIHRQPLNPRQANMSTPTGSETEVARAGGVLNPEAAAEANQRDATATRAFSATAIKAANGQCLFVDPTAGDFRENLIPVQLKACDGSVEQQFDVITKGKHITTEGSALVVSAATQGCLNFDPRRAQDDQVIMFSCGGRADGEGQQTDSQLFSFKAGQKSLPLALSNGGDSTCIVPNGGKLGSAACNGDAGQLFTIG